ncbi:MAG: hypothetical protein MI923_24845 [Phycisphaerales bacterium]|nr:hypothetical protein [Phycisphaerales bacterium]
MLNWKKCANDSGNPSSRKDRSYRLVVAVVLLAALLIIGTKTSPDGLDDPENSIPSGESPAQIDDMLQANMGTGTGACCLCFRLCVVFDE